MPPLTSGDLHRVARQELGPTLGNLGFKRMRSGDVAAWLRPEADRWLVTWVQPWRSADSPGTGEFTVELRLSSRPETGGDGPRRRLPKLLTDAEREELRRATWTATRSPDDLWLRHTDPDDTRALMAFLAGALPAAIERVLG